MSDEVYSRIQGVFRKYNPNFVYRELEGGHHLHLNTPETVAPNINRFLDKKFDTSAAQEEEHKPQFDLWKLKTENTTNTTIRQNYTHFGVVFKIHVRPFWIILVTNIKKCD